MSLAAFTFILCAIAATLANAVMVYVCWRLMHRAERAARAARARQLAERDQHAAAVRDGFHHCASCGELIHPGPQGYGYGYVHVRSRVPMCDPHTTGSQVPTFAEPRMPRSGWLRSLDQDAVAEPGDTVTLAAVKLCRTCAQPIEPNPDPSPLGEPWRHTGGGPSCWPVDGNQPRDPDLLGNVAEPPRVCSECGEPETAAAPLIGTAALALNGAPAWYCRDVVPCAKRKLDRGRAIHALPDGFRLPPYTPEGELELPAGVGLLGDVGAAAFLNGAAAGDEDLDQDANGYPAALGYAGPWTSADEAARAWVLRDQS